MVGIYITCMLLLDQPRDKSNKVFILFHHCCILKVHIAVIYSNLQPHTTEPVHVHVYNIPKQYMYEHYNELLLSQMYYSHVLRPVR